MILCILFHLQFFPSLLLSLIRKGQINKKKFQREKFYNSIWFKAKFKANNRIQTSYAFGTYLGKTVTALFITRREKKRDLELGCVVWTIWNSVGVLKKNGLICAGVTLL